MLCESPFCWSCHLSLILQDSLWAAEDIEAVFDQDPQRVCILQGPVAARHSIVKDEPIKVLLGNINSTLIERLLKRRYGGDASKVPTIDYLRPRPAPVSLRTSGEQPVAKYSVGTDLPQTSEWLEELAGPEINWLSAFLTSPFVVRGGSYIDSPIRRLLAPRRNQEVHVKYDGHTPKSLVVYGAARSYGTHKPDFKAVEVCYHASTNVIDVTVFEDRRDVSVPLLMQFKYERSMGYAPIHEIIDGRNKRIKQFYWKLWYGDDEELPHIDIRDTFVGPEVTIEADDIETFCSVVGNQDQSYKATRNSAVMAPMDFAIVTGWQVHVDNFIG
jgi:fatty acid synthase subunit alpha, fungi type